MQENHNSLAQAGLIFMGMIAKKKKKGVELKISSDFLTDNYLKGPHAKIQLAPIRYIPFNKKKTRPLWI